MAIFGKKDTKSPFDKLVEDYNALPDEDKAKFKEKITDVEKAEDEREIDKIEEEKADTTAKADEKAEEVNDESKEIGKDIDEAEDLDKKDKAEEVETEEDGEDMPTESKKDVDDVREAQDAKMDAFFEEWEVYKGKVDKLYERLDTVDEPAQTVGLSKQKAVESADDEESMSAYDYAMKHAKY